LALDLGFLGTGPFAYEIPDFGGWKSLDFLGFSRPNQDLSMGYEGFSESVFSLRFLPDVTVATHDRRWSSWALEAQASPWSKLRLISDFLQGIAV
jgi:hypothetical protein